MPIAVFALSLSMFAIGTTEFVIVGLLPTVSDHLHTNISTTGLVVTAYALGIAIGGPLLTTLTARWERRRLLLSLMALFVLGNVACAVAPSFGLLIAARVFTAFAHAGFAAAGIVLAVSLVDEDRQGRAIAAMFGGLTIALVIGVPLGTFIGQHLGWRWAFWAVAITGTLATLADARLLPKADAPPAVPLRAQMALLADKRIVRALLISLLGFGGQIVAYTYITPFLERISGFASGDISLLLVLFGAAAAAGTFLGGSLVDRWPRTIPVIYLSALTGVLAITTLIAEGKVGAIIALIAWGAIGFGIAPILQHQAGRAAGENAGIVAALNISAFNLGIAGGAFVGGRVVADISLHSVTLVGAGGVLLAVALASAGAVARRPAASGAPASAVSPG